MFVAATNTTVQAKYAYAKTLSGTMKQLGIPTQPLLTLASSLRASGAAIPLHQATPITRAELMLWARYQPIPVRLATMIAWKTASRWGEVVQLRPVNFILRSPEEVIIDWSTIPKARRANPYKPSKFAVIRGDMTPEIFSMLKDCRDGSTICTVSTSDLDHTWATDPKMAKYSAHSIKRGAITLLTELAAADRTIDPTHISLLAKHEHVTVLATMTIRYGGNPIALARLLGTGNVTKLL